MTYRDEQFTMKVSGSERSGRGHAATHLSMLMAVRLRMEAVQNMTSNMMKASQRNGPKFHIPLVT